MDRAHWKRRCSINPPAFITYTAFIIIIMPTVIPPVNSFFFDSFALIMDVLILKDKIIRSVSRSLFSD